MCLITAHAHALHQLKILETEIADLRAEYQTVLPSGYSIYSMTWRAVIDMLSRHGIQLMLKSEFVPDSDVFYTDRESWEKIAPFLMYPADDYVADAADCDDYARWATSDSSRLFKLNGCLECWGHMPQGYHGFNLIITGSDSFVLHEPNAGFGLGGLFEQGDNGYNAESWK